MNKADIEFEIKQLTELQNICNQIKAVESFKQNNDELLQVLKENYKLSAEDLSIIESAVEGKRKKGKNDKSEKSADIATLKKKFKSYCDLLDINLVKRNGEILGYTEVSNKCSNKKSLLKSKIGLNEE
jgi:hypothetical protein